MTATYNPRTHVSAAVTAELDAATETEAAQ